MSCFTGSFTIPKKKKKDAVIETEKEIPTPQKGIWSAKEINLTSDSVKDEVLAIFSNHALDRDVWKNMEPVEMRIFTNDYLTWKFNEAKRQLRNVKGGEIVTYGFREIIGGMKEENYIAKNGLRVGSTVIGDIGDPMLGVYVYRHPDTVSSTMHFFENVTCTIMVFKTLRGKMTAAGIGSATMEPQMDYNCHVAEKAGDLTQHAKRRVEHRLSALYHYEWKPDGMSTYKFPATVIPYAVVKFRPNIKTSSYNFKSFFGLFTTKFSEFKSIQLSETPTTLKVPGYDAFSVYIKTPMRKSEVPNGLYDMNIEFGDAVFYPFEQMEKVPELFDIQTAFFGQLLDKAESCRLGCAPNFGYVTYNILEFDKKSEPAQKIKFKELIESMMVSAVFAVAIDACEVQHYFFPSGEIASAYGLPNIEDVLHCISVSKDPFVVPQYRDYVLHSELEIIYATTSEKIIDHLEVKPENPEFLRLQNQMAKEYHHEKFGTSISLPNVPPSVPMPVPPPSAVPQYQRPSNEHVVDDDDWDDDWTPPPPIPLPPPGKSILYKPPTQRTGAPIGPKAKRRPQFRVRWNDDVVDNDNKEKSSNMLAKKGEEERCGMGRKEPLSADEKAALKPGNDRFKEMFQASVTVTSERDKPRPGILVKRDMPSTTERSASSERFDNRQKEDDPLKLPVSFSSIKSLPLPIRPTTSADNIVPMSPLSEENGKEQIEIEQRIEEAGSISMDMEQTIEEEEEGNKEKDIVEEKEEEEEEKKTEEENDILKMCFSSSRPVESESKQKERGPDKASLLSVLKFSAKTMEILGRNNKKTGDGSAEESTSGIERDVDLRIGKESNESIAFHLNPPKKTEVIPTLTPIVSKGIFGIEEDEDMREKHTEDRDYRREKIQHAQNDKDDRRRGDHHNHHSSSHHHHHHSHSSHSHHRRDSNETSKDQKKSSPESIIQPSEGELIKKKLGDQLQGLLRQRGKDIDQRIDGRNQQNQQQRSVVNIVSNGAPLNILGQLGISPQILNAARQASTGEEYIEPQPAQHQQKLSSAIQKNFVDSPASPPPGMVVHSNMASVGDIESPESPAPTQEIEEIKEIEEVYVPETIIPKKQPLVVPMEGKEGWETVYEHEEKMKKVDETTPLKPRDTSWLTSIQKQIKEKDEEDGEIVSDVEEITDKNKTEDIIEIDEEDVTIVSDTDRNVVQIPEIPQDRDDRIVRKSRFDAPPPQMMMMQQQQQPPRMGTMIPQQPPQPVRTTSRFGPPIGHIQQGQTPIRHFAPPPITTQTTPTLPPPFGGIGVGRQPLIGRGGGLVGRGGRGGPAVRLGGGGTGGHNPYHMAQYGMRGGIGVAGAGIHHPFNNRMHFQQGHSQSRNIVVVADSMIFNRAVMDSNVFNLLLEKLRGNLMSGTVTKLFVHHNVYQRLMTSSNESQLSYRTALMAHRGTLVCVMDQHACDEDNYQQARGLHCMTEIKKNYKNHNVIFLSNMSSESEYARQLGQMGVRTLKLEQLMQELLKM